MARPLAFAGAAGGSPREDRPSKLMLLNPAISAPMFVKEMRHKHQRRKFFTYFAAKMIGVTLAVGVGFALVWYFNASAGAQDAAVEAAGPAAGDIINPLNTMWTLIAAFLVFFMQAGFMMLEAGFARERETVNVLLECIVDTCLCGLLFFAFGFAFMFGTGNGFIGTEGFFLLDAGPTYGSTGIAFLAFFLFQLAFADTCSTITSGAMVGRCGFVGDLLYSVGVSGFIYPILGHWVWGPGGWLGSPAEGTPFRDFAGSTVVHTVGAMVALAGAIALGPRLGRKFKRDGGSMPPGHDMTIAAVGGIILWFGWYGFNPGSTLSAMDAEGIGRVALNTTLAASAGGLVTMFFVYPRSKKWDPGMTINGFLGGLVAITAPCYWVSPLGAIAIGAIAGVIVPLAVDFIEWLRVDDPIGAVAVHGACGIFGTIAVGLFAANLYGVTGTTGADNSAPVAGLFYGGGADQLLAQVKGSVVVTASALALGLALMYAVKLTGTLRVSEAGELEGLDIHEHGGPAYHFELGSSGFSIPTSTEPSVPSKAKSDLKV